MPKITIDLNAEAIGRALKEVRAYEKKVDRLEEKVTEKLVEDGVKIAKENADYLSIYDTGELVNGIYGETNGNVGHVVSSAPHSAFCEFGTGIRGASSPHPNPGLVSWRYDVNEHGEEGWWYLGDDGNWHWTAGMPSRPYMYNTANELRQKAGEIVKEVLE